MSIRSTISQLSLGAVALAAASLAAPAAYAAAPESNDPIKIALFDWTSVNLNAKILGGILEKLGYTVEYPTADYLSSLTTGLTNGDLDCRHGVLGHDGRRSDEGFRRHRPDREASARSAPRPRKNGGIRNT